MRISGKVAIVTGGTQGIGKGIVYALLRRAAKVAILDIDDAKGEALQATLKDEFGEGQAVYRHCDVTHKKQLEDVFTSVKREFGGLNIVVNNAGISSPENWEKEVDINLKSVIRGNKLGIEMMDKNSGNDGGVIINMASIGGLYPQLEIATYGSTKAGVINYTRSLKTVAKTNGVQVNSICPTFVSGTVMGEQAIHFPGFKDLVEKHGVVSIDMVVDAVVKTIEDDSLAGSAIVVTEHQGSYKFEFAKLKL